MEITRRNRIWDGIYGFFILNFTLTLIECIAITAVALSNLPNGYNKSVSEKTGNALKSALHKIIDGHTVLKYTNSNNKDWLDSKKIDLWQ